MMAKRPQSTSELAERLGTSQANVSQQLKQLELAGFVARRRARGKGKHYEYLIPEERMHLTYLGPRTALRKLMDGSDMERFIAGLQLHPHNIALMTFVLGHPELIRGMRAMGVLDRSSPELFVIADSVDDIRREHANITLDTLEGQARLVLWSHTMAEVEQGLDRGDQYFYDALAQIGLMYDPKGVLMELKRLMEEKR